MICVQHLREILTSEHAAGYIVIAGLACASLPDAQSSTYAVSQLPVVRLECARMQQSLRFAVCFWMGNGLC